MKTLINLGLVRSTNAAVFGPLGGPLDMAQVCAVLHAMWGQTWKAWTFVSDTEPTLVIEVSAKVSHATLLRLAQAFDQDCVAAYDPSQGIGILAGPKASLWGPFNADYFLTSGGRRLSEMVDTIAA